MFTSCKPENDDYYINQVNDNQPTSIMEYFDFYKTQCDAEFMMQSTKSTYSEPSFSAMASIKGNQFPKGLCVDGQNALRSQDYYYSKSADKSFSNFHNNDFIIDPKNLYGRQFQISNLVNDVSLKSLHELGDTTICFPQLISVHFENLQDGKVVAGSKIVWNIDANNENRGIVSIKEALSVAEEEGLDLIEISPQANPPVCKVLDFGKYRYEQQKRKNTNE